MKRFFIPIVLAAFSLAILGCDPPQQQKQPSSASGVSKANVQVKVGSDGLTVEQRNIAERIKRDNDASSIKHFYKVSPYTGKILMYSTVRGKVTSSGKRLTPSSIIVGSSVSPQGNWRPGFDVGIGGGTYATDEVLGDDGTYGSSGDYLYWFDANGVYRQTYRGSCEIEVSDQPLRFNAQTMTFEIEK